MSKKQKRRLEKRLFFYKKIQKIPLFYGFFIHITIRKENQMIGDCMNPVKRLIQFGKKLLPRIGILTLAVILSKGKIQFVNVECLVTVAIVMGIIDIVIDVIQNILLRNITAIKLLLAFAITIFSGFIELGVAVNIVIGFVINGVLPFILLGFAVSNIWYQVGITKVTPEEMSLEEDNKNE